MKAKISDPRQRLLDTATELFYNQGYRATGINQVIREAGVARASLYLHFASKEALLIAFLQYRHQYWFDALKTWTEKTAKPKEQIMAAFDFLHDINEKEHFRGCAFLNILSEMTDKDAAVLQVIQEHKKDLRAYLGHILVKEKQALKDQVYLLFEAAMIESQLYRHQWPVQEARKAVSGLL
ncbi:TetR/AcrR family transcriptional regulator [Chitinophaga nivalis]|uniref:TetR/AcrR family transcriptional regulator n=1 Tax=Chitinophaga nivalis TaxID=2991709 RepID=A0ABT3IH43_9BACT|nr:TetR/AcrR family transcriptional regulator [Chitinophaga nivalis]MCW3467224.1 TetR/AcrR family transcriptional regulator [Chitinophaga nivalis]MCW3483084.1 TetR/AcrR family transcriptional regulator [Chitinophaga nivalis]